jgi:acyl carrier protein
MQATSQDIKDNIRRFIIDQLHFGQGTVDDDASLLENGFIDSTGVLELVGHIETTYDLKVENNELTPDNLDSISSIATYVSSKLASGGSKRGP